MTDTLPIFLNPHAGRGAEAESEALQEAFESIGARPQIHLVEGPKLEPEIKNAIRDGVPILGAAGGDGTISAAANVLTGSQTALLPVPMGTLNHFSRRYGITNLEDALLALQQNNITAIHTGCVNDRIFVNNASCGFYPHIVRHRDYLEKWLPRVPAMWIAGMRVFAAMPMMQLSIGFNDRTERVRTPALWVGIGRNSLRLPETGDAEPEATAPVLEIVTGRAQTRREMVRLAIKMIWHMKRGLQPQDPALAVWRAAEFTLESKHRVDIALDGEAYRMRGPLTFRIRKEELRVLSLVSPA